MWMVCTRLDVGRWAHFTHNTPDTKRVGFSLAPAGCPSLQFSPGMTCWGLLWDATGSTVGSNKTSVAPDTSYTFQVAICTSDQRAINLRVSTLLSLLRFENSLEKLTEPRTTLTSTGLLWRIQLRNGQREEMHRRRERCTDHHPPCT